MRFMNAGNEVPPYVAMACLLVREGANWHAASMLGVDVMALCPPEMAPLIHRVASESQRYLLSLSPQLCIFGISAFCSLLHIGSVIRFSEVLLLVMVLIHLRRRAFGRYKR